MTRALFWSSLGCTLLKSWLLRECWHISSGCQVPLGVVEIRKLEHLRCLWVTRLGQADRRTGAIDRAICRSARDTGWCYRQEPRINPTKPPRRLRRPHPACAAGGPAALYAGAAGPRSRREVTVEQVERHHIDQPWLPLERREHIECKAGRRVPLTRTRRPPRAN